jgi:hypothetical protein
MANFCARRFLPALNRPKTEIAELLGVSRQTLYSQDILAAFCRLLEST